MPTKKLVLAKETLRAIQTEFLESVNGGTQTTFTGRPGPTRCFRDSYAPICGGEFTEGC